MLIGSKVQLKSLDVDDFILSYDDTPLELVENANYLGMFINCDISWEFHARRLCQITYYHISLLRRLRRIFPMNLLLQVYKSYIQPHSKSCDKADNGEFRLYKLSWNWPCKEFEFIRERRDYFLTFKAIHGIAPHYLSDRIDMHFDIHSYDTREAGSMTVYRPSVHKEMCRNTFFILGW